MAMERTFGGSAFALSMVLVIAACAPAPRTFELPRSEGMQATVVLFERVLGDGSSVVERAFALGNERRGDFLDTELVRAPKDPVIYRIRVDVLLYPQALVDLGIPEGRLEPSSSGAGRALPMPARALAAVLAGESLAPFEELAELSRAVLRFRFVSIQRRR